MTYLKTSWFSFGNFLSTSLRACNFCSRSLISEKRKNQTFMVTACGCSGAQSRYGSRAAGETSGWRPPSSAAGPSRRTALGFRQSLCPGVHTWQWHGSRAQAYLGPRGPLKGNAVCQGLPGPHHQNSRVQRDSIIKNTILCSSGCPWRQTSPRGKPACFLARRVSDATHPRRQTA